MKPEHFLETLFLRAPLLSYAQYPAVPMDLVLDDHQFRLAIYLASPGLYRMLEAKDFSMAALSPKELLTLKKYYNRMSFRPTPFGLFSSDSLVRWSDSGPVELDPPCKAALSLLPDQQVATAVSQILAAAGIADEYELNPTLYRLGSEFRFIKTMRATESSCSVFTGVHRDQSADARAVAAAGLRRQTRQRDPGIPH